MAVGLKAETLYPKSGSHRVSPGESRSVTIVGGGLAGCAAAVILAERGVEVTLIEAEASLGGRLRGWRDELKDGTQFEMDRGFHAFFRQYYNLRALLTRIKSDPEMGNLIPLTDYPLLGPDGKAESFSGLPKTTPLNLMSLVMRTPTIKPRDLLGIPTWPTFEMLAYDEASTYRRFDDMTASAFMDSLNFPAEARQMLFEVFAHSFFNPEEDMSAADMLRMFHIYFTGNPEGLIFDVMDRPFDRGLWQPLQRYLERNGVTLVLSSRVESLQKKGDTWRVQHSAGKAIASDAVVLALHVPALKALVAASEGISVGGWADRVQAQQPTNAFAIWRMWLDQRAGEDREPFAGTAGLGIIDNISLYERFHDESAHWSLHHNGGSVVELHAYALPDAIKDDPEAVKAQLWQGMVDAYPELEGATVLDERFRIDQDCPAFPPGHAHVRPTTDTPHDGLVLAGDFVRLPFPAALMEAATSSGMLAANKLLERWGVRGEPLTTLPRKGMLTSPAEGRVARARRAVATWREQGRLFFGRRPQVPKQAALTGPDWQQASPARIQRSLDDAMRLPAGGWYVVDASRNIGQSPKDYIIDGREIVVWRDVVGGQLKAGPASCPHMGASLACAKVEAGEIVCPWHGLKLGNSRHGSWAPMTMYDDGVLAWVQLEDGTAKTPAPILPPRPAQYMDAVIVMDAKCDPEDVIANRLDPWHGAWFHPYSFDKLVVTEVTDQKMEMRVSYRVAGPVVMEVDVTFHCPDPRTIVMTIVDGEGVGSVVETHATPVGPGQTRIIEATLATSDRKGFGRVQKVARFIRPFIQRSAERLWVDDVAYAERRYALRQKGEIDDRLVRVG